MQRFFRQSPFCSCPASQFSPFLLSSAGACNRSVGRLRCWACGVRLRVRSASVAAPAHAA